MLGVSPRASRADINRVIGRAAYIAGERLVLDLPREFLAQLSAPRPGSADLTGMR